MKKLVVFLTFSIFLFANNDYKMYENYVNQILNYSLRLKAPIYNLFYKPYENIVKKDSKKYKKIIQDKSTLKILAILNDKVLLSYNFVNKKEQKWLKVGESIAGYKIIKIKKGVVLLKYKNKIEKLKQNMNDNKFHLKVSK